MRWVWGKDKMVLYVECLAPGICRLSAPDMEETYACGRYGVSYRNSG
mgnify:CR=1 FL=1